MSEHDNYNRLGSEIYAITKADNQAEEGNSDRHQEEEEEESGGWTSRPPASQPAASRPAGERVGKRPQTPAHMTAALVISSRDRGNFPWLIIIVICYYFHSYYYYCSDYVCALGADHQLGRSGLIELDTFFAIQYFRTRTHARARAPTLTTQTLAQLAHLGA